MKFFAFLFTLFTIILMGCSSQETFQEVITPTLDITKTIKVEEKQSPTILQTATPTITPSPTANAVNICSPLFDFPIENLVNMISNPYHPPKPGSDDPHQGVDFSVIDPGLRIALKGFAVQSILSGEVVMVMNDRFPYGNAIVVETPFRNLPVGWREKLASQTKPDLFGINPFLTCPAGWGHLVQENMDLSLYILYAHLDTPTAHALGDQVDCGDEIGSIGDSGNALAPHLHVEMRYGYSSGIKGSMAHYTVSADEQDMSNYCRWRVSGWFRLMDPMDLLFPNSGS